MRQISHAVFAPYMYIFFVLTRYFIISLLSLLLRMLVWSFEKSDMYIITNETINHRSHNRRTISFDKHLIVYVIHVTVCLMLLLKVPENLTYITLQ